MVPLFKQVALVTATSTYNFVNERKEEVAGVTVEYLFAENLAPCADGEARGYKSSKDSLPYAMKDVFKAVPALYELSFSMQATRGGKPQLKLNNASLVSEVELVRKKV